MMTVRCGCRRMNYTSAPSGDPLIMGKVLGNIWVVTLGTGKKKGLWNVTSIAYLESSIPDKSKINNEGNCNEKTMVINFSELLQ